MCHQCRQDLVGSSRDGAEYFVINARAYSAKALLAPTTYFNEVFQKCIFSLTEAVPQVCHLKNISKILKSILINVCKDDKFHCKNHNLKSMLCNYIIQFHLYVWTKNVNKILKGKLTVSPRTTDRIKLYAFEKFKKRKSLYANRKS